MRVATMVIALVLMFVVFIQSVLVATGSSLADDEETGGAAAVGVLVAFLYLLGGGFALGKPIVSVVVFVLAGILGIAAGASSTPVLSGCPGARGDWLTS